MGCQPYSTIVTSANQKNTNQTLISIPVYYLLKKKNYQVEETFRTLSLHHVFDRSCRSLISSVTFCPSQAAPMCGANKVIGVSFSKFGISKDAPCLTRVSIATLFFAIIAQCSAVLPCKCSVKECDAPNVSSKRVGSRL